MGRISPNQEGEPASPATNFFDIFPDSSDQLMKVKDYKGVLHVLTSMRNGLNYINNPDMGVNQKVSAALANVVSPTATGRAALLDRWFHTVGNITTPQFSTIDTIALPESGLNARFYSRLLQLTNAAKHCVSQVMEGRDCIKLRGKKVRLQVKIRKSVGADKTISLMLLQLTSAGTVDTIPATFISAFNGAGVEPTWGTNIASITPDSDKLDNVTVAENRLQCAITSVWQRFSGVFTVPSNCVNLIAVIVSDDVLAVNDNLLFSEFDLHEGQEINRYQESNFAEELLKCQRFFQKSFQYSVVPVQNGGLIGAAKGLVTLAGAVALASNIFYRFSVTMRIIPTITLFNPSVANAAMRRYTATATDQTATATANIGDGSLEITATGDAAGIVGDKVAIHLTANAEI